MQNKKIKTAFSFIELASVILVIGVILGLVVASQSIIKGSTINNAKNFTKNSIVNSMNGLILWLEATQEDSFDESERSDGSTVTNWYDRRPQTNSPTNATQSGTDSLKPVYASKGINNLPVLEFDGGDILRTGYNFTFQNKGTIFAVATATASDTSYKQILGQWGAGANREFTLGKNNSNLYYVANPTATLISSTNSVNNPVILTLFHNPSLTNPLNLYVNGSLEAQSNPTFETNAITLDIGGLNGTGSWIGQIGEIILFDRALTATERQAVEEYLSNKWGIDLS